MACRIPQQFNSTHPKPQGTEIGFDLDIAYGYNSYKILHVFTVATRYYTFTAVLQQIFQQILQQIIIITLYITGDITCLQ